MSEQTFQAAAGALSCGTAFPILVCPRYCPGGRSHEKFWWVRLRNGERRGKDLFAAGKEPVVLPSGSKEFLLRFKARPGPRVPRFELRYQLVYLVWHVCVGRILRGLHEGQMFASGFPGQTRQQIRKFPRLKETLCVSAPVPAQGS